ncbi:hypothetical protein ACJJTC_007938 [Scirpophaga incertulas]
MGKGGKTTQEFIQCSFSPTIAVLCSPKVNNVVSQNNLSLIELLQPFSTLEIDGQFRDPSGSLCTVKSWKLFLRDINWKPLQPTEARRQLNNAVLYNYNDKIVTLEIGGRKFDIPQSTPWFDAWRETYLEVQFPSDHEYTKHFISCIIVGTTYDDNIIDTFNSLNQQYAQLQNIAPPKLPKWFSNGVLKSYLLLNDASAISKERAEAIFETVKQTFGTSNCFILSINSRTNMDSNLSTDFWEPYIKRAPDSGTMVETSSLINLPTSIPLQPHTTLSQSTMNNSGDENLVVSINPGQTHPLTPTENDSYDNANSLQTCSFSGSSESMHAASKPSEHLNEIHGCALNANDIDAIKKFMQDYATKALLPYLEKQIAQLSEVVANRKGVSRSLLSATKRWFGTSKPGNNTASNTVIYTNDCPELQLRRLGDLYFLCGQWQRAFDAYHTAKREFYADSAWLCYAGALEMAAVSAFMAGDTNRKTYGYMEESIVTYLNTCRMVQYAVRATLLSVLCLSAAGLHGEAAKQLIRMTSEDSDLRSAMLLEQASLCFLSGPGSKAMCRKYAFHMVLAGHRFSKAGQKKHAYRCYKQAYQVYEGSGWRLSTDHVQFALGRLAGALKLPSDALRWLAAPLAPSGHQPPHQQEAFLREYILAHQQWLENCEEAKGKLPQLPLPLLQRAATAVLCVGPVPLSSPGRTHASSIAFTDYKKISKEEDRYWHKLEEVLLQVAQGSVPMIFKSTIDLYTESADSNPLVSQGEPIQISITLRNPLKITLLLKDVELLWQFTPNSENENVQVISNEQMVANGNNMDSNIIVGQKLKSVILEGDCSKALIFQVTPLQVGKLNIHGLAYKLINAGEGSTTDTGIGKMISGKVSLSSALSNTEKRLQIKVIPEAPCLQMTFTDTPVEALGNELRTVDMELKNVGPMDMKNVYIAVSHPDSITPLTDDVGDGVKTLYDDRYRELYANNDERAARIQAWKRTAARHTFLAADVVGRGASVHVRLLLRPHALAPALYLLAYYETGDGARPYRLLRHVFRFNVTETIEVSITPRRSLRANSDKILENLILSVDFKHIFNENTEEIYVEVLETSLLSRQWRLTDITKVTNKTDLLAPHEKLHLILKAKRILEDLPEGKVEHTCLKVSSKYSESPNEKVTHYKFISDYKPSLIDNCDMSNEILNSKTGLIESMFVIRWRATIKSKSRSVIGQHCLWLKCFNKIVSHDRQQKPPETSILQLDESESKINVTDNKQKIRKDNVLCCLEHTNTIQHNFKQTKLCIVPITINVVNCYEVPVKVFIDMSKQQSRESSGELGWAGALSNGPDVEDTKVGVCVRLGRFESRRVSVRALAAAPGTYLVGAALALTSVRADDRRAATCLTNNTSLLVIQQTH